MRNVLFICTGNTCRSPMAEALMQQIAADEGLAVEARSAGLYAVDGSSASEQALTVLAENGIELAHRSRTIDLDLLEWADVVLVMTESHRLGVVRAFPEMMDKTFVLKTYADRDPQVTKLTKQLDQLYVEMEAKRTEWQAVFDAAKDEQAEQSTEEAWEKVMQPLLAQERDLRKELSQVTLNQDVQDPFGGTLAEYRACMQELDTVIRQLIGKWQ